MKEVRNEKRRWQEIREEESRYEKRREEEKWEEERKGEERQQVNFLQYTSHILLIYCTNESVLLHYLSHWIFTYSSWLLSPFYFFCFALIYFLWMHCPPLLYHHHHPPRSLFYFFFFSFSTSFPCSISFPLLYSLTLSLFFFSLSLSLSLSPSSPFSSTPLSFSSLLFFSLFRYHITEYLPKTAVLDMEWRLQVPGTVDAKKGCQYKTWKSM